MSLSRTPRLHHHTHHTMTPHSWHQVTLLMLLALCSLWCTREAAAAPAAASDAHPVLLDLLKDLLGFGLDWMFGERKLTRKSQESSTNKVALQVVQLYLSQPRADFSKGSSGGGEGGTGTTRALLSLLMSQLAAKKRASAAPPAHDDDSSSFGSMIGNKLAEFAAPALG